MRRGSGWRFPGLAFYNPKSEITLRIATREDEELDEAFFRTHLEMARLTANR